MSRKIHRGRRSVFRKKRAWVKPFVWSVVLVALVVGGFFLASAVLKEKPEMVPSSPEESSADTSYEENSDFPESEAPETEGALVDITGPVRAVYISLPVLCEKAQGGLDAWLKTLANDGHNSVVVQLKDYAGNVYYQSSVQNAAVDKAVTDDAVSKQLLADIRRQMEESGFRLIPQLSAFYDAVAPRALASARIPYGPDPSQCWLDDSFAAGGKAWLNPYADEAHEYILGYVRELREMGFMIQLLDGVQFPFQTYLAGFDTTVHKDKSRGEVLSLFVSRVKETLGEDGVLMLAARGLAVTSIDVKIYGNNPADFGADIVVPQLYTGEMGSVQTLAGTKVNVTQEPLQAISLATRQIVTRPAADGMVTVALNVNDFTAEQLSEVLKAVEKEMGETASYVLYAPNGMYN